jgi:hypothetical protein
MTKKNYYRITTDILPLNIDHRYHGDGIFGEGTYFSLEYRVSFSLSDNEFAIIIAYDISPLNPLIINSKDEPDLRDATEIIINSEKLAMSLKKKIGSKLECWDLCKLTSKNKRDVLVVQGKGDMTPDGGNQLIIPAASSLSPTPIWFDVCLPNTEKWTPVIKKLASFGEIRHANDHTDIVGISWENAPKVDRILRGARTDF